MLISPRLLAACLWMMSRAAVADDDVSLVISAEGRLADAVRITIMTMGDDWEQTVATGSEAERFALLRVRASSPSGSASLHPKRMQFIAGDEIDAAKLFAVSLDMNVVKDVMLHPVAGAPGQALYPLIPKSEGLFELVYVVKSDIKEGIFYFDGRPAGRVRFTH